MYIEPRYVEFRGVCGLWSYVVPCVLPHMHTINKQTSIASLCNLVDRSAD